MLLISTLACVMGPEERPGKFVPTGISANPEFGRALIDFYEPINPVDLKRLEETIAGTCDLRKAARGVHYSALQLYQGDFTPGETRGTFCIWNPKEELIEFGQYDARGQLRGVHATFYRGKLRSVLAGVDAGRNIRVARGWDWVLNNRKWKVTLAYIKFENLRPNRTVEYIFERETGHLVKRREYRVAADGKKTHLGVHYNGYPAEDRKPCLEFLPGGRTRVIEGRCEFKDNILPGSNRF
ncbi:MAG: hypothetical protein NXI24_13680 [bacterium]|nr:hypothetical protein [bacterium]